ncbi:DUF6230 family protein [Streptomyces sp. NPDC055092]
MTENETPDAETHGAAHGRTSYKRAAVLAVPAFVAIGAMGIAMAQGAMAATFAVSGTNFKVSSGELTSDALASYVEVDRSVDGKGHAVSLLSLKQAKLTDICQSTGVKTPIGRVVFRLQAGGDAGKVTADSLVIDAEDLAGDAKFGDVQIGRDASTLDAVPGTQGKPGSFGLQVKGVDVSGVKSHAWSAMGGNFKLNGLKINVGLGGKECF